MRILLLSVLFLLPSLRAESDLRSKTCAQLIDDLQNLESPTAGLHPTAWVSQFLAQETEPQFGGGIIGSQRPVVFAPMRELVVRGAAAIPEILRHLDDARPTKLEIKEENHISWAQICNDYNNRPLRGRPPYKYIEASLGLPYRVLVGDVCLVILGQITNRPQVGVRYKPSGGVLISSPIRFPEIVACAREDWKGFSAADLCALLLDDIPQSKFEQEEDGAMRRIRFYFPEKLSEAIEAQKLKADKDLEGTPEKSTPSKPSQPPVVPLP
jgi:hypothetical protein